ncbi:energy transducer TonB [Acinetobacter sp. MB5]|uniref:energy transducer TonB n=1 Tax=Acinetobacter sp. MB5 TaxID=2069438 RepID=UPI000DCFD232|nr:energy transducer TonB [Acinetobacter sp. MB5]
MSHSPVLNLDPNPSDHMKKKILTALAVVVVGHVGVLWALGQMKIQDLKPIHKDPLHVRFVKIQQPPKPLPPKPKEKPKPQEKPKEVKEVKIVEKQLPPPPKKVEKIQQVKAPSPKKAVEQTVVKAPVTPVVTTTTSVVTKPTPQPAPQPVTPQPSAPAADPSPKTVSIGGSGVQWSRSPHISYDGSELQGSARSVVVLIEADEKGKITKVTIVKSSGVSALDEKVLRAVRGAKFKPYKENGVAYPIKAKQPFDLTP